MGFKLNILLSGNDRRRDALKPMSHLKHPLETADENTCISETYSWAWTNKEPVAYGK